MGRMITNQDHADQLLTEAAHIAERVGARRRALLCAVVCLNTTTTLNGALRALGEWNGPVTIREDAAAILDALACHVTSTKRRAGRSNVPTTKRRPVQHRRRLTGQSLKKADRPDAA